MKKTNGLCGEGAELSPYKSTKRIVLLCTLGKSPQVITETVWALAHEAQPIIPDEIIAVTTANYAKGAADKLFDTSSGWGDLIIRLHKALKCKTGRLRFDKSSIRIVQDSHGVVNDLRTVGDNERFANYLYRLVKSITDGAESDNTVLLFSLSGGRKSMSAIATSVMTLLARPNDRLLHVIIDMEMENEKFHFPKKCAGVSLFEVPFVRTRDLLHGVSVDKANSFSECVEVTQGSISGKTIFPELRLDVDMGTLQIGQRKIKNIDCARFALLWLLFMRKGKRRGDFYDGILTIANKDHKLEFSTLGFIPKWVEELHSKDKIVAFNRILDDTRRMLKKDSLLTAFQVAALLPRCKNSHTHFEESSYPLDKLIVSESLFSNALYETLSARLGWK